MLGVLSVFLGVLLSAEAFKLSDLPVLKKWEIPSHHFSKHIGRKNKDLESIDTKRSHYWELRPEYTANELDWYEDPEKVKLDFNYKGFLENEASTSEKMHPVAKSRGKPVVRSHIATAKANDVKKKRKKQNKSSVTHKKSTIALKRHRRSSDPIDFSRYSISAPKYLLVEDAVDIFDERNKRDTISQFLSNKVPSARNPNRLKSRRVEISNTKEEIAQQQLSRRTAEQILKLRKIKDGGGMLGDEQTVARNKLKSSNVANNTKSKAGDLPKNQKTIAKQQDVKATTREKIPSKDKFNMDIVPNNVARAVAMAMDQLKRDKMWGKVFVHVRPSGQLKVMVQETRKMDESTK